MEHSSSRLYSGPLSEAAQKVLVALRAQNLHAVRHNRTYYSHNQMGRYGSVREDCTQSTRSIAQEERRDRNADRPQVSSFSTSHHKPSSYSHSPQTLAYCQYSKTPESSLSSFSYSCWDSALQRQTSETEANYHRSQMYPHRKYSQSPVYQSSQALSLPQHEVYETTASFCHENKHTGSLEIPKRLPDQATFWRKSTVEIRPSFILSLSPGDECPSEVLFSTMENPNTHKEEPALAHHPVSSCPKVSVETNGTSGEQKDRKGTGCWNIPINKVEDVVSDSQLKWKQPLFDHTDEATNGIEDGRLRKQSKSETSRTGRIHLSSSGFLPREDTNSPKSVRDLVGQEGAEFVVNSENTNKTGTELMSDTDCEMEVGINGASEEETDSVLPNEKISTSANEDILFLGTDEDTNLESSLYLVTTINMDKSTDCNSGGPRFVEREENGCNFSVCEIKEAEHPQSSEKEVLSAGKNSGGLLKIIPLLSGNYKVGPCQAESRQVSSQTVIETEEKDQTGERVAQCVPPKFVLVDTNPNNLVRTTKERVNMMEIGLEGDTESRAKADINIDIDDIMEAEQSRCSVVQTRQKQCEYELVSDLTGRDTGPGESRKDGDDSGVIVVDSEGASIEDSGRESCATPMLSQEYKAKRKRIKVLCHQTTNGYVRGSSSCVVASAFASRQNSSSVEDLNSTATKPREKLENSNMAASQAHSHHARLVPSFPLKRKHEVLQHQNGNHLLKIHLIRRPPKWEPPCSSQEKAGEVKVSEWKTAKPKNSILEPPSVPPEPQTKASSSCETEIMIGVHTELYVPKQTQQRKSKIDHSGHRSTSKQTSCSVICQSPKHKQAKCEPDQAASMSQTSHEGANTGELRPRSTAGSLTTLISDPRIKDSGKLNQDEKMQLFDEVGQAKTLVLTMLYEDGATQLDPEQKFTPPVCGLLVLTKNDLDCSTPEDFVGPNDSLVYLKLQQTPVWAQQHTHERQKLFTRDVLLQVLSRPQLVVCYKAKDLLCTALQFYKQDLNWKQVAGCHIHDPQVSGWLLDPADISSCYQDLLMKHQRPCKKPALGTKKASRVISGLSSLYWLNKELCSKLQSQGLWELYVNMELKMIPILAAMESHCIHVDKEALKRTSDLLGTKMKELEQEAHRAAGQMFLVTSNSQLRTVLFEKLRLHERCENKKLPKTINKQQQSTSEATLLQLQDLHPLPKVILEYRQVHKIKSTFVDGILSCMMNKCYISSTWHQTCVVTGRISAKHPNFQALPRQPLQITRKPYIQGKEQEVVTVHPRAMFIPQAGWTFLAADFCQVELRLLAHLSSDPELLRIFTNPQVDVFTMLASQWKGISEGEVTSEDREHAKRIVYSVVYGAGRTRLSGILGVSAEQARQFQDSFLQTYREVQTFIQRTILQCRKQGYVLSIMGRRRTLPNINSPDWGIRMQAERQAVNFVVQGSAADLCKMAMIRIFNLVSSSSSLSARLIAQLHDELLYEVEDSQVEHFAASVKSTMESLQHIHHFGIHLKVPLKVAVSSGKSWGSMSELNIPSIPTPCL